MSAFTANKKSFPILCLPLELRRRIYTHHLTHPHPIRIWEASNPSITICTNLLKTNHQIRSEATSIFYAANTFQLWCPRICATNVMHDPKAPYCFKERPDVAVARFIDNMQAYGHMIRDMEIILFAPLWCKYIEPCFMTGARLPPKFHDTFTSLHTVKVAFAINECPYGVPKSAYSADFRDADWVTDRSLCDAFEKFKEGFRVPAEKVAVLERIEGKRLRGEMCLGRVEWEWRVWSGWWEQHRLTISLFMAGLFWGILHRLLNP